MRALLFLLIFVTQAFSQTLPIGSRSMALNTQQAVVDERAGVSFLNPALLTTQPGFSLWLNHYNPFGISEIDVYALALNYTGNKLGLGAGYLQYGNDLYHERLYVAAGAVNLTSKFHLGLKFKHRRLSIQNYGDAGSSSIDLGMYSPIHRQFAIGFLIKNLVAAEVGRSGEKPTRRLLTGGKILLFDKSHFYFEVSQEQGFEPDYKMAFDYQPISRLTFRAGTGLNGVSSFAGGFGFRLLRFSIDYAFQNHFALSQSHVFSLTLFGGGR